jgi:hypothetical protein
VKKEEPPRFSDNPNYLLQKNLAITPWAPLWISNYCASMNKLFETKIIYVTIGN